MASNGSVDNLSHGDSETTHPDISAAEAALKARLSRKRTKTGCLTCRKRRIKCGEERPVCKNCMKSKRQCEGYTQRVVFKQPAFDYQQTTNGGAHITFQAGPAPGPLMPYDNDYGQVILDPSFYAQQQPTIAAHSIPSFPEVQHRCAPGEEEQANFAQQAGHPQGAAHHPNIHVNPNLAPRNANGIPFSQHPSRVRTASSSFAPYDQVTVNPPLNHIPTPRTLVPNAVAGGQNPYHVEWQQPYAIAQELPPHSRSPTTSATRVSPASSISTRTLSWNQSSTAENWTQVPVSQSYVPLPKPPQLIDVQQPQRAEPRVTESVATARTSATQPQHHSLLEFYEHKQNLPITDSTNNFLSEAAVESLDDDYYDVDEEMDVDTLAMTTLDHERHQNLQRILQNNHISIGDLHTRQYDTFLYEGILDRYRVEDAANPLKNPATARVFAHFISVVAPSLSIFERHPRNSSVLFTDRQVPLSQQGLWTYTMPVAALHNQGLLHSMLALASLHIARLQNASDTPSRQHYAWACKRINHLLGPRSKKRHKTTTIAASMLLGFYEIFTADHRAWNLHLTGSKQLVLETDFVSLTGHFRRLKRERVARQRSGSEAPPAWSAYRQSQDEMLDQSHDVDENLVSRLFGKKVNYDGPGQAVTPQSGVPNDFDIGNFEILRDLFWWYLKQDAYQSIISGNPLLLEFSRWGNCPPRAPVGKPEAVYGSFDHLMLLLGRIADFSSRDRKRKLRQMEANGGQWKRASEINNAHAHNRHRSQPTTPLSASGGRPMGGDYFAAGSAPAPAPPAPPMFYGMAPPPRQGVHMPSAYMPTMHQPTSLPSTPVEEPDLKIATNSALEEYGRIRAALLEFEHSLGPAFQPLSSEYQLPVETPFGPALAFRSYDIACLWAIYYMAMIVTIRSHPHMHPAAHVAAGLAAQDTAFFANEIGRITAGILPGPPNQAINPSLGAALWETCIPSFFAAIQYQTPQQRHATVTRIHNIGVRTGWGTAETIANGCETAWVKAAAAGRGPPYTRIARPEYSDDPRLNGHADRLDPNGIPDGKDDRDRRLVKTNAEARLTWAIGILGQEGDDDTRPSPSY